METNYSRPPKVSVMMCVYNGQAHIAEAVASILAQSFADLELIVVDDGSTDDTAVILQTITDPRLHVFSQSHLGIPQARNHALAQAGGEYLAVLDADDTAVPSRLEQQIAFLDAQPHIVVVGSAYLQEDHLRGRTIRVTPPTDDGAIRQAMLRGNPFCHSTVMMRRTAVNQSGPYAEDFPYVQDYELWTRLALTGQMANLPDFLVTRHYHQHSVSNSWRKEGLRLWLFMRANSRAIRRLGYPWYHQLRVLLALRFIPLDLYATLRSSRLHANKP
ncbi:MAG: glycosyltransferase [Chloroflexi bacterium]|nr:glycosyltransferase [Chloroflexota bacterium]